MRPPRGYVLPALALCLAFAGCTHIVRYRVPGTVLDRSHLPATSGYGISTSGKMVFTSTSEQWTVTVDTGGDIQTFKDLTPRAWSVLPPGTHCIVVYYQEWYNGPDLEVLTW